VKENYDLKYYGVNDMQMLKCGVGRVDSSGSGEVAVLGICEHG
jgi:hypothetical protein